MSHPRLSLPHIKLGIIPRSFFPPSPERGRHWHILWRLPYPPALNLEHRFLAGLVVDLCARGHIITKSIFRSCLATLIYTGELRMVIYHVRLRYGIFFMSCLCRRTGLQIWLLTGVILQRASIDLDSRSSYLGFLHFAWCTLLPSSWIPKVLDLTSAFLGILWGIFRGTFPDDSVLLPRSRS